MYYLPLSAETGGDASKNGTLPIVAGLVNDLSTRRFVSLPLWTSLQVCQNQFVSAMNCVYVFKIDMRVLNFPGPRERWYSNKDNSSCGVI